MAIVTTLFNSADALSDLLGRLSRTFTSLDVDWYLVAVNDGSPQQERERAILSDWARYSSVPGVYVDLSRNFGHHNAILAGLSAVPLDAALVGIIDSDLDEEPEWFADFVGTLCRERADCVYAYEATRTGNLFRRISGGAYWSSVRALCDLDIPANVMTFRVMTRRFAEAVTLHQERAVSIGGLFALTGFKQVAVPRLRSNTRSSTNYGIRLKVWHAANSITAFSNRPLEVISIAGALVTAVGLLLLAWTVTSVVVLGSNLEAWLSVLVSIWLLGGISILSLGIVAIYISKILVEVKGRPRVIVRDTLDLDLL